MNRAHYLVLLTALLLSLMTAVSLANESNNGPDGTNANEPHGTDSSGAESEAPSTADTESTTIDSEDAVEQAPPAGSGEPAPSTETGDHPQNCESVPSILDSQNRYKSDNPGYDPASQSGVHPYREWLFEPTSQEAVEQINSYVSQRFGDDVLDRLDSGLVGTPSDHTSQRIAVVVDPAVVDIAELQADFDAEVGPDIALVVPSCNSAQAIRDVIVALRTDNDIWGDSERQFDIDARRQVVKVGFKPRSPAAEQFLNAEFGDLVELSEPYTPYAGNRMGDEENHYGGAAIRGSSDWYNVCTSGFTVRLDNGNLGSVTAGHCFPNNTPVYSGNYYGTPATQYYGETSRKQNSPYDMQVISTWLR